MLLAPTKSREKVFCSRSTSETTDLWRRVHSKGYFSYIKISYVHKFNESFENINLNVIDSSPARPSNFPYCFTISSSSLSIFQFQEIKVNGFFSINFFIHNLCTWFWDEEHSFLTEVDSFFFLLSMKIQITDGTQSRIFEILPALRGKPQ